MKKEPKPSPLPESVEEAAHKETATQKGMTNNEVIWYLKGAKFGYQCHQTHHSAEAERLRQALQLFVDDFDKGYTKMTPNMISKASEALKEK